MTSSVSLKQKPLESEKELRTCLGSIEGTEGAPAKGHRAKRIAIVAVALVLVVAGVAAAFEFYGQSQTVAPGPGPNPCGQVYEGQSRPEFVMCKGFVLTETGAICSLSTGSCTMTVINNDTSRYEVVTTECFVDLPIMVNDSGITVTNVEAINGGPAASGIPTGSESDATCWFPTNKYMANITIDQGVNGCFTFAQKGNPANTVGLCWSFGKWSATSVTNPSLDCPALVGNLGVSFTSLNVSVGYAAVSNANPYGVWLAGVNGTSTVGPLGFAVSGPYGWFAVPQNETVAAKSTVTLNLPGTPNAGQRVSYTLSFLPTNETITYTQPCSLSYQGTIPTTSGQGSP
jgi:hypothetical protein